MKAEDQLAARLLAGDDRLSRIEKEAVLDDVLATVAPARRTRWVWLALPALAAVALLLIAPWHSSEPELAARGGSSPVAVMHVSCGTCTRGAKLVFDLHGTTSYRYFAAFTKRGDGTVLWYFPTTDAETSTTFPTSGILDRGIVLGDDHPAGTYRVYGVFSSAPLTRTAIRDAFDATHLTAGASTEVVTADVEVR